MNTTASYMGVTLSNPVVAGASHLTATPQGAKKIEENGAGGLVIKSLFEEELGLEQFLVDEQAAELNYRHPEMIDMFPEHEEVGPEKHLYNVEQIKESVDIPVFGSLNAVSSKAWTDYATLMEKTGIDGLELNFFATPRDTSTTGASIEAEQIGILKDVVDCISIPVSVKLSVLYSNPLNVIKSFDEAGASAVVLFNRFFEPDIDASEEKHAFPLNFSSPGDHRLALRFSGLLEGQLNADICANTGIFSGEDVAKMLLAGADCVQVVSALYKHKVSHLAKMLTGFQDWMKAHEYEAIEDFKGSMSRRNTRDYWAYTRGQYAASLLRQNPVGERTSV